MRLRLRVMAVYVHICDVAPAHNDTPRTQWTPQRRVALQAASKRIVRRWSNEWLQYIEQHRRRKLCEQFVIASFKQARLVIHVIIVSHLLCINKSKLEHEAPDKTGLDG